MNPLISYFMWFNKYGEQRFRKVIKNLVEAHHWTPHYICQELTVVQLFALLGKDDNEMSWEMFIADRIAKKKAKEAENAKR